ncbi:hypothetical protein [Falsiphaeobacter marinintestinus]|uniref:hypothetical protein n=1 Tax=Falsiphaeobacter marinintestinus TaxID=1492905 RepID=UPI0011B53108|nr:hypothetical protein [Phaeobacter marinintestinus]
MCIFSGKRLKAGLFSILLSLAATANSETLHEVKVGLHVGGVVSNGAALAAVDTMNSLLKMTGHVECKDIRFVLERQPEPFSDGLPRAITSAADFSAFRQSPYSINVVSQVLYCGGHQVAAGASFGGCTTVGAKPVIVTPSGSAGTRALKWLHELGHSQGLRDRCKDRKNSCRDDIGWIMAGILHPDNRKLSIEECFAYAGAQNFPVLEVTDFTSDGLDREFLEMEYIHGLPIAPILEASSEDLAMVREVVAERDAALLPNAVLVLGLIGDPTDQEALLGVLEGPSEDHGARIAKLNAVTALGYLLNRFDDPKTFGALRSFSNPNQNQRYFEGAGSFELAEEFARAMSRSALMGVGMANPKDEQLAQSTRGFIDDQEQAQLKGAFDLHIDESFFEELETTRKRVGDSGILGYLAQRPEETQ